MSKIIGFMIKHSDDKEYWSPKLSKEDENKIFSILEKYETSNAQFDDSIRGNLKVIDEDEEGENI